MLGGVIPPTYILFIELSGFQQAVIFLVNVVGYLANNVGFFANFAVNSTNFIGFFA